ncbi:hypothetical protein ACQP2P_25190 [Dactylosporangium sp. CA-139114]|uniref:hypothetical protein n=1 Tax=Dactylosporangium sp. CA-139114 TaxID=3239931 RepID=UPI003D992481
MVQDQAAFAALVEARRRELRVPPLPLWVEGRSVYLDGIQGNADAGEYRFAETAANQPAMAGRCSTRPPGRGCGSGATTTTACYG